MKKTFIILVIIAAAVAAWIVAFPGNNPLKRLFSSNSTNDGSELDKVLPNAEQPIPTENIQPGSFQPQTPITQDLLGFPLMKGSTGMYVRNMQAALNDRYGSDLVVDGIFGTKTYKSVSSHGFDPDAVTYTDYQRMLGIIY